MKPMLMNQTRPYRIIAVTVTLLMASTGWAGERLQWSNEASAGLTTSIENGVYGNVTSVLILRDGERLFEYYREGMDETPTNNTRSVTKTITGMAIGLANDRGIEKVDEPLAGFFSEIAPFKNPDSRKMQITAEDLLTMSGPLECDDWNQFSRGNEERMYVVEDWSSFFWNLPIRGFPAWASRARSAPYERSFSYCTAGVQVLGEVVERAAGIPFTDFVEKYLFAPLSIDSFRWSRNGLGQAHMGGGLELTTRDLAKLAELQRNNGMVGGNVILSDKWTKASVLPRTVIPESPYEYGYLWWLRSYDIDGETYQSTMMSGNGGNRVIAFDEFGVTVVITKTDFNTPGMHDKTDAFISEEIVARLVID